MPPKLCDPINFKLPANHHRPLGVVVATVVVNVVLEPEILDPQGRGDGGVGASQGYQFDKFTEIILSKPVIKYFTIEILG